MMAKTLGQDDTFRFGSEARGWGYGRVVIPGASIYVEVLKPVYFDDPSPEDWAGEERLACGWTFDARLYSGDWEKRPRASGASPVGLPSYKVGANGKTWLTDVYGDFIREATGAEEQSLEYKFSTSPILFEKAFWGFHSDDWNRSFDRVFSQAQLVRIDRTE